MKNKFITQLSLVFVFSSALCLFFLQPLFSKAIAPSAGGSPSVWIAVLVWFQTAYFLGTFLGRFLSAKHIFTHFLATIILCLGSLPFIFKAGVIDVNITGFSSTFYALFLLGGPLPVALSMVSSLIARVFESDGLSGAKVFFFSNLGSFFALIAFLFAENYFPISTNFTITIAFLSLGILFAIPRLIKSFKSEALQSGVSTWMEKNSFLYVIFLAFIATGLLNSTSTKISVDIGSIPLLWIPVLLVFLGAMTIGFTNVIKKFEKLIVVLHFGGVVLFILSTYFDSLFFGTNSDKFLFLIVFYIYCAATLNVCVKIASLRPRQAEQQASFAFAMAVGGMFGGWFFGVFPIFIFPHPVEWEFALLLSLTPFISFKKVWTIKEIAFIASVILAAIVFILPSSIPVKFFFFLLPLFFSIFSKKSIAASILLYTALGAFGKFDGVHETARSFFGTMKVVYVSDEDDKQRRILMHGTTNHGYGFWKDGEKLEMPTSYYSEGSPPHGLISQEGVRRVLVLGLGSGNMATLQTEERKIEFIEIDPKVYDLAKRHFDLSEDIQVYIGDGRRIARELVEAGEKYDIVVMDAFTSVYVPMHLITTEALSEYKKLLNPDGVILINISNRNYDFIPLIAANAKALGLRGFIAWHSPEKINLHAPSIWGVIAENDNLLAESETDWIEILPVTDIVWRDAYAPLLPLMFSRK